MVFPQVDALPRHPSQLYEFALEGIVLFVLLWFFSRRPRPRARCRGCSWSATACRFVAEFTRQPDNFLGFLALGLSMGQWLSLPMIVAGIVMMVWAYRRAAKPEPTVREQAN